MRRAIPQPHFTDRSVLWRSAGVLLALAAALSVGELLVLAPADRTAASWFGLVVPLVGAGIAWRFGPQLRPKTSYLLGRTFLVLATLPVAVSVYTWRSTPLAGAVTFHYLVIVLFAAVFFNRRDLTEQLLVIGVVHATTLALDAISGQNVLSWSLTMFGVLSVAVVLGNLVARMHALSFQDPLTNAANRRAWDIAVNHGLDEIGRSWSVVSMLLVDIDHFKQVNDEGGHEAGDTMLRDAVATWRPKIRATDCLARIGGDEFGVLLPGCDQVNARRVGQMMLKTLSESTGGACSIGIATTHSSVSPDVLFAAADRELYRAKQAGRATLRSGDVADIADMPSVASKAS
jgi:diguanylate cyclase (GGDEF)-like protein